MVEQHTDFVYNVAYRMMGNARDAEDITQETFLSAYRGWSSFRGGSSVSTWLYRIAVNACLMRLRKEKMARASTETGYRDGKETDWTATLLDNPQNRPERIALSSELRQEIESAITELPPDLRAAV
ncbi:MAG: sigma-70 family RNA polymerase sigma factor, partial [Planctomycetota bacterium]|nr:sigma-70 family RNA polymerase sigma factor [Planctomycetota bacterium]